MQKIPANVHTKEPSFRKDDFTARRQNLDNPALLDIIYCKHNSREREKGVITVNV